MGDTETVGARLVTWFAAAARRLPWREGERDPYRVLLAELMLQQTQVERVVPRFEAFLGHFPDLAAVAAASEDEVVAAWSGLGYYRRARALHRLARELEGDPEGLPRDAASLARLPGIGRYTAAAVATFGGGIPAPVVDGNVSRVAARVLGLEGDPRRAAERRRVEAWVRRLMEAEPPAQIGEALIELGATVCRPKAPRCSVCPLAPDCLALVRGRPEARPPPRQARPPEALRWVAACCVASDGRWLLRRVDAGPILRGLWLPALAELETGDEPVARALALVQAVAGRGRRLRAVRHSITHRRIEVVPVVLGPSARLADLGDGWRWVDPAAPDLPTSSLLGKLTEAVATT